MTKRKPPYTLDLSELDREALERVRCSISGCKSGADAIRRLIRDADGKRLVSLPPTKIGAYQMIDSALGNIASIVPACSVLEEAQIAAANADANVKPSTQSAKPLSTAKATDGLPLGREKAAYGSLAKRGNKRH